jgi:[acyl-carrier-protein] S-malonyltransferase
MQKACEISPSTMAAIIGLDDIVVEDVCRSVEETVVTANYNCPGQIVISGSNEGIDKAIELLKAKGAKMAVKLAVGGAFHSPLMEPAKIELEEAIRNTHFHNPLCPVYQNINARPSIDPDEIKANLVGQLTSPVRWTQTIKNMISDGATSFTEVGPGRVLQGLIKKINKDMTTDGASFQAL